MSAMDLVILTYTAKNPLCYCAGMSSCTSKQAFIKVKDEKEIPSMQDCYEPLLAVKMHSNC